MKHRKRELDIFSLSFLDVISCGFGAVVMLILIAKTDVDVSIAGAEDVSSLLASLIGLENSVAEISQQIQHLPMTRIMIAHRQETIQMAQRVFHLDAGKLIDQSSNEEALLYENSVR